MDTHSYKPVGKVQEHILMSSLNFLNISRIFFLVWWTHPGQVLSQGILHNHLNSVNSLKNGFIKARLL